MSSGKWEIVNGVRFPVEDTGRSGKNDQTFTHDGKEWDVIREITFEEAKEITGTQKKDWSEVTDEELMCHTLGYGHCRLEEEPLSGSIIVNINADKVELPFGFIETGPLLELLWRKTGADCPGEEGHLEFPHGTYHIIITE